MGTWQDWLYRTFQGLALESWEILTEASPYLIFGFAIAGLLYVFVRPDLVVRYLGSGKQRSVIMASLLGIPLPLCSCGVVPTAVALKKQGASDGASVAFLISTPESGIDSIAITYALMDSIMTVARPLVAFLTATITGIVTNLWGEKPRQYTQHPEPMNKTSERCNVSECAPRVRQINDSLGKRIRSGFRYAFIDLFGDISGWLVIGIFLAGTISYSIPDNWVSAFLGRGFTSLLAALFLGIPLYICATATTPIAAALVLKGMSPGAALVFLLAGPATNLASLPVVAGIFGKRTTVIYLSCIAVVTLAAGVALDCLYTGLGLTAAVKVGQAGGIFSPAVEVPSAMILIALIFYSAWRRLRGRLSLKMSSPNHINQK